MVINLAGKKSFTLIELVVSVGLVSILAVSALVNLSNIKDKKSISSEANEIKTQIERARVMALNPSEEYSGYNYFGVKIYQSEKKYELVARTKVSEDDTPPKIISSFLFSTGSSVNSDKSIFFGVKEQGKVVNRSSGESFKLSKAGLKKIISISYPFGVVEVK